MKTIIIDGIGIEYDDTLVLVLEGKTEVLIEAVSHFNKVSQMPSCIRDVDAVRKAIERETAIQQQMPSWKFRNIKPKQYLKSKYPYESRTKYALSLCDGMFRSDFPWVIRYSISYFNRLVANAGFEFNGSGSSHSDPAKLSKHIAKAKLWLKMGLIRKSDWVHVLSKYKDDSFITTFGTLIGFSYAKDPSKYYNKHFRTK